MGGSGSTSDRELIAQLITLLGPYSRNDAAAALIVLLSSSSSLAPSLMTQVLMLLEQIGNCSADATVCQSACSLVLSRCAACAGDPNCRASMERVCGPGSSSCP